VPGLSTGKPPIIPGDATTLTGAYADPLPQALVLTAIVIGFAVLAFAIALVLRAYTRPAATTSTPSGNPTPDSRASKRPSTCLPTPH
jgi:multisubunit Na+/H+ antiporter MnhC subunit